VSRIAATCRAAARARRDRRCRLPGVRRGLRPGAWPLLEAAGRCRDRRVVIRLTIRRFFCSCAGCKRKTFAEPIPGLTARSRPTAPRAGPRSPSQRTRPAGDRPHLGWGLHTVQRYARAATWQDLADRRWRGPRPSRLDPFKPYLDQHFDGGRGSITRLFNEITALGYDGSYPVVRDYLSTRGPPGNHCPRPRRPSATCEGNGP
jgi:hypothetical protein